MIYKYFVIAFTMISSVLSWGPIGHQAVASIGQSFLSGTASQAISKQIPNGDMVSVANWADEVRGLPAFKWSEPLHFINTPSWNCSYIRERDCYNENGQYLMCVDGAIQNYTNRLFADVDDNGDSLKFLIHFHGDIQQPLHCGFQADRGGNNIHVDLLSKKTNLHSVWDSGIIEYNIDNNYNGDWTQWVSYLKQNIINSTVNCNFFNGQCSQQMGDQSTHLACQYAYVLPDGSPITNGTRLDIDYIQKNIPIIDRQIAIGGYLLATNLNRIFDV